MVNHINNNNNNNNNNTVQTKKELNVVAVIVTILIVIMVLVSLYYAFACPKVTVGQVLFSIFLAPIYLIYRAARPNC